MLSTRNWTKSCMKKLEHDICMMQYAREMETKQVMTCFHKAHSLHVSWKCHNKEMLPEQPYACSCHPCTFFPAASCRYTLIDENDHVITCILTFISVLWELRRCLQNVSKEQGRGVGWGMSQVHQSLSFWESVPWGEDTGNLGQNPTWLNL